MVASSNTRAEQLAEAVLEARALLTRWVEMADEENLPAATERDLKVYEIAARRALDLFDMGFAYTLRDKDYVTALEASRE